MKIELYCRCGAGAEGEVESEKAAQEFRELWFQLHSGSEHGECQKNEATRIFNQKLGSKP